MVTPHPDWKWWHDAVCHGMNPEIFTTLGNGVTGTARFALDTCNECPVRAQCRDDMLETRPTGVIAGGWRWDHNGHPTPHPDDVAVAEVLIAAAAARVNARGKA